MHQLLFQDGAIHDLADMDKDVARRIISRLNWLTQNITSIKRASLAGELSDYYKFRVGDYRILYQVFDNRKTVVIHRAGHRREVYRGK